MTKDDYDECLGGYHIIDCAIRSRRIFSFIAREKDDGAYEPNKRIINYFADNEAGSRIGVDEFSGFQWPMLAVSHKPKTQAVMVSSSGDVAVLGGGENGVEQSILRDGKDSPLFSTAKGITTIGGVIYVVGGHRCVCYRESASHWVSLRKNLPFPTNDRAVDLGFSGIDGFHAGDIYCAGGNGDAWHYNGGKWTQCPIPTNMILYNVCCAGDGQVYIGAQNGSLLKGRNNNWQVIHKSDGGLPFKDIVWFQDTLWCTNDYGLWQVVNDKLIEADIPPGIHACSGNLSVGDGVLLLAGMYGAAVFDGKQWEMLISP